MGGVPKKHDSKSKVGTRRSQKKLHRQNLISCPKCSAPMLPHRQCDACGYRPQKKKSAGQQVKA